MIDKVMPGPVSGSAGIREAVCIHTKKICDSCRDRDCIEDLRLYLTRASQSAVDRAVGIRGGRAELLCANLNVEPTGFQRNYYTVEVRYFYRITAEALVGTARPVPITGLAAFDKRVILCGGEEGPKTFSSQTDGCCADAIAGQGLPTAVLEAVDPILLSLCMDEPSCCRPCGRPRGCEFTEIPAGISEYFECDLEFSPERRRVYASLGQFSVIHLERDAQLLIPVYDNCVPCKECIEGAGCSVSDDPCELFKQVCFPEDAFFPPLSTDCGNEFGCGCDQGCGCGCAPVPPCDCAPCAQPTPLQED